MIQDIFNKKLFKIRKDKVAHLFDHHNFLRIELAKHLAEQIMEIKQSFLLGLDLGAHIGELKKSLLPNNKVNTLIQLDGSLELLKKNPYHNKINADIENIPLKNNTLDIICSCCTLHNINNIKSVFKKIYDLLKNGGLFALQLPTTGTLATLQEALFTAELKIFNRVTPRVHPFPNIKSLTNIVQNAGFKEITAHKDTIEIMYKDFSSLIQDLRNTGETSLIKDTYKDSLNKRFLFELKQSLSNHIQKADQHYIIPFHYATIFGWKS